MFTSPISSLVFELDAGISIDAIIPDVGVPFGISMFSFTSGSLNISCVVLTTGVVIDGTFEAAGAAYVTSPSALYLELECEAVFEWDV